MILKALDEVSKIGVKCRREPGVLLAQNIVPNSTWIISNAIEKAKKFSLKIHDVKKTQQLFLFFSFILADYQTIHNVYSNMLLTRDYCDWAVMAYSGQMHLLQALRQSARLENINLVWYHQVEKAR